MRAVFAAGVLGAFLGCAKGGPAMPQAVVVVAKGVVTLDPGRPRATALAMKGGKLLYVGDRSGALDAAGPGATVDELDGYVVPGLADAHAHLASLGRSLSTARLEDAVDEASAVAAVVAKRDAPEAHQGEWLLGRGWDQNDWKSKQFPTRQSLDAALPGVPVYLRRIDGHAAWVSSAGLAQVGITRQTKDPEGGRILRDAKGEPTGVLVDNAMDLVELKLPPPTDEQVKRQLKAAIERCMAVGLTSVHDAGMDLRTFQQLQTWDAVGALPIRVYAMADAQGEEAETYLERGPFEGRHLRMKAAKLLADGALGSRGAALELPYLDEPGTSGLLLMSEAELARKATAFADRGFQVAIHAIGDRANRIVIELLTRLEQKRPHARHRVEHAQLLTGPLVERLKRAGLVVSFQPTHATSDMPWAAARVGEKRLEFAYAWRSVLDTGAHVAFGSDFPVERPDVLLGLYAARTRQDLEGKPAGGWHPEQRVSGEEALAGFTSGAAYAEFAEDRRGMIKVGYDADFTALSLDPVEGDAAALPKAQVLVTVVDGVDVYRK